MIRILNSKGKQIEGEVAAKCAMGYYKVTIIVDEGKLVDSSCECGEKICKHAIKLYMRYMRLKGEGIIK
ncbi:SWIM zinc finger family protein [Sulfuracidifex metallicus]|jgi:hypothetical protein|uniref:SWIM-type domain-containing protein n=1 Tax=Sulfuracidifex metallicus DSM 6482 = JCM 9184 TaxID=523847 RepID=A0A6A9QRB5_SULME|nr:SWIM zinc finger family protein [Sulfuracidifex metallicus]MCY0850598.1 hypothetical protein [Sulfuracidifex metallicus]MUN28353.1 hypothetical protein [Sulfuracidifex metallicus DSM 6482 = JCM 9184]WOE51123.1 hypothetical protein RQ359_000372 [Sulfuracidifex metallicus DSM 6482 = JCM 9184]